MQWKLFIDEKIKNEFKSTFNFSNNINKFILLFRKGIYPYEYMVECENFNETSLLEKQRIKLIHSLQIK